MALTTLTFPGPHPVWWNWPLQVGIPVQIEALGEDLRKGYWTGEFAMIENVSSGRHYNIIFFDSDRPFDNYLPLEDCSADLIFVFSNSIDSLNSIIAGQGDKLLEYYRANGILAFTTDNLPDWFSKFAEELSHNNNVVDALFNSNVNGVFKYDPKLETETTLSKSTENLINDLRTGSLSQQSFEVETEIGIRKYFTSSQFADYLQDALSTAVFDSEMGFASKRNRATRTVKEHKGSKPTEGIYRRQRFDRGPTTSAMPPPETAPPAMANGGGGVKKNGGGTPKKKSQKKKAIKKKSKREKRGKKPAKATASPLPPGTSRYLQAAIETDDKMRVKKALKPNTPYKLQVRIGFENEEFTDPGEEFDTSTVFEKSKKKEEPIQVQFKSNFTDKIQSGTIKLPREGESDTTAFEFKTDKKSKSFEAEVFAYHQNRLIQHVQLSKPISKKESSGKMKMKVVFSTRRNLSNLDDRTKFSASIEYEAGKKKSSSLRGITKNKPVDLYFSDGLKIHLDDMKLAIEEALIDIKKHPMQLDAPGNVSLLSFLASKGSLIRNNHIRDAIAPDGPLQIVSNRQEWVPLDFVYSLNPPEENATLCKHAAAALEAGKCKNCFDHQLDPAPHICPFGFWSFSRIVERHSYLKRKNNKNSDYSIVSEPDGKRNTLSVLQNSIYGSSARVETDKTKGIRKEIGTGIKKVTKAIFNADDWKTWTETIVQHQPDSLFLVVHVEKDKIKKIDKIELGSKDFMSQEYFGSRVLVKKKMKSPPFIVIIGCETSNLKTSGFDISAQFINEGAAIVLSNFTKIRGRQAKDIVIKLAEFISQNAKKEVAFGEIMLRLRQYLLSQGMIAGLSLVAQGDADWKIKT